MFCVLISPYTSEITFETRFKLNLNVIEINVRNLIRCLRTSSVNLQLENKKLWKFAECCPFLLFLYYNFVYFWDLGSLSTFIELILNILQVRGAEIVMRNYFS